MGPAILRSITHPCTIHLDEMLPCRDRYCALHGLRGSAPGTGYSGRGIESAGNRLLAGTFSPLQGGTQPRPSFAMPRS